MTRAEALEHILYEVRDGVALVTLNDPEKLNVIDHGPGSMADDLLRALAIADADPDVRCVVLSGAGRAFSAGGHTAGGEPLESPVEWYEFLEGNTRETDEIRSMRKPTIGAINGICYGFGLILATHLDMLVAVDTARFGLIETRFGSTGVQTLPFLVGPQWAKFLALTGEIITANKAKEIGLVLEVFPAETFEEKTLDLARRVAAMPKEGVMFNRRVVNSALMVMGWAVQRDFALALNTLTNLHVRDARAADGRVLSEVMRSEGWKAFKTARDAPFETPWLGE
jgi:enoyl-CoA hydratase/carnithine racemase